jgi:hypothetical protein
VDCVISNCVINLAPDKPAVFREIARVLKPGGRLAVSDIALKQSLPAELATDMMAYVGCIAGAIPIADYRQALLDARFSHVEVVDSGADLNAYAKLDNQSGCCSSPTQENTAASRSLPVAVSSCCSTDVTEMSPDVHEGLAALLKRYNVNDFAASVKVYAIK